MESQQAEILFTLQLKTFITDIVGPTTEKVDSEIGKEIQNNLLKKTTFVFQLSVESVTFMSSSVYTMAGLGTFISLLLPPVEDLSNKLLNKRHQKELGT